MANRWIDQVRRRVQNETLGHRGRKRDPVYRIRKLLLTENERLDGASGIACRWACASATPTTDGLGVAFRVIGPRHLPRRHLARRRGAAQHGDRRLPGRRVPAIVSLDTTSFHGGARSWPTTPPHEQRTDRRAEPMRKRSEALRSRLPHLRALSPRVLLHAGGVSWPTRPRPPRVPTSTPAHSHTACIAQRGLSSPLLALHRGSADAVAEGPADLIGRRTAYAVTWAAISHAGTYAERAHRCVTPEAGTSC
jgi:hypothetical protein